MPSNSGNEHWRHDIIRANDPETSVKALAEDKYLLAVEWSKPGIVYDIHLCQHQETSAVSGACTYVPIQLPIVEGCSKSL